MFFSATNHHEVKSTWEQATASWQNIAESVPSYIVPSSHPVSTDSMLTTQEQWPGVKKENILQ